MDDNKKEKIMFILAIISVLICFCYTITHPVKYIDLTPQEQIMYERMIFP